MLLQAGTLDSAGVDCEDLRGEPLGRTAAKDTPTGADAADPGEDRGGGARY